VHHLQNANVQLASRMARVAMAHVTDPPKLCSLDYKKIQKWLKKYKEYEILGGTGLMNKFIEKAQMLILMVDANVNVTSARTKDTFTNIEVEVLLQRYNETKNLDQSIRRLKDETQFSVKGLYSTSEELSTFYEEFEDTVISLGNQFKPDKKIIKEIFISKIKPSSFQQAVRNETGTKELFPDFTTVFVKAYKLLMDAKNASATVGWYNQTIVAPVASQAKEIYNKESKIKRKFSGEESEKNKLNKVNPSVSRLADNLL
jgi:hypothetical protein